jgi:hypothetical protein
VARSGAAMKAQLIRPPGRPTAKLSTTEPPITVDRLTAG